MSSSNNQPPSYSRIRQWVLEYGVPGCDDRRAASDFLEIEAAESINAFRGELHALSQGNYHEDTMNKLVGPVRKQRHGSYDEWARAMLRWMAKT